MDWRGMYCSLTCERDERLGIARHGITSCRYFLLHQIKSENTYWCELPVHEFQFLHLLYVIPVTALRGIAILHPSCAKAGIAISLTSAAAPSTCTSCSTHAAHEVSRPGYDLSVHDPTI